GLDGVAVDAFVRLAGKRPESCGVPAAAPGARAGGAAAGEGDRGGADREAEQGTSREGGGVHGELLVVAVDGIEPVRAEGARVSVANLQTSACPGQGRYGIVMTDRADGADRRALAGAPRTGIPAARRRRAGVLLALGGGVASALMSDRIGRGDIPKDAGSFEKSR